MTATCPELLGFREVAGLRTVDGGRIRPGLLYRSGTPQFLDLPTARRLVRDTGIRSTIDLRLPHEVAQEGRGPLDALGIGHVPHPVRVGALVAAGSAVAPMPGDDPIVQTYLRYLDDGAEEIVGVLPDLLRPGTVPTLVHCTVGKDRTGVVVALVLAAVGVRRDDIVADYVAGAADVGPAMERLRRMASYGDAVDVYPPATWVVEAEAMRRFLDAVDERHGGVCPFLHANGVPPTIVEELTEVLVEHPPDPRAAEELP
ncbi:tyrosine-protein phosphatase [Geodermatophilus amargosae]|uniref:tyrosine-protein phosphatase n=1 Tax=Geodermatophilus amargosae TaxID=1296565 RepID=UPI0034DEDC07